MKIPTKFLFAFFVILVPFISYSQEAYWQYNTKNDEINTRILFIFDMSNSMNGYWETDKKINTARKLFSEILDSLGQIDNLDLALRMYGHQYHVPPQICADTKLEVPFGKGNIQQIKDKIMNTVPKGTTPIARSLRNCAKDFPDAPNCRNIIILITDGIEECDGDPCAIALALQSKGIILKPFIIGIGLDVEIADAFKCIGTFYNAQTENELGNVMKSVVNQVLSKTTCQVNLLDQRGLATETNVGMTFYNQNNNQMIYNFMHTMNSRGLPDTLEISSQITYRVDIHTIPKVTVKNVNLTPGEHTIIPANTPQGSLLIKEKVTNKYEGTKIIVRKGGDCKTLHTQTFGIPEKYIVGSYDIEVLTLPRLYFNDVKVSQGQTKVIDIPQPGIATITLPAKGCAYLYMVKNDQLELLYTINHTLNESINLQPGKYFIMYRSFNMKRSQFTVRKAFEIVSGRSEFINMTN